MSDKRLVRAGTHLVAVAIGWGVASLVLWFTEASKSRDQLDPVVSRSGIAPKGSSVLARLVGMEKTMPVDGPSYDQRQATFRARVQSLRKSLPPSADPAAAAIKAISEAPRPEAGDWGILGDVRSMAAQADPDASLAQRVEIAVRSLQWIEADSNTALDYFDQRGDLPEETQAAVRLWAEEVTPSEVLSRFTQPGYKASRGPLLKGLIKRMGESGDLGALSEYRMEISKDPTADKFGNDPWRDVTNQWRQDGAADLVSKAAEWKDGRLMTLAIRRMTPEDFCKRLPALLSTPAAWNLTHAGVPAYVIQSQILENSAMSLEGRLALIRSLQGHSGGGDGLSSVEEDVKGQIEDVDSKRLYSSGIRDAALSSYRSGFIDEKEAERLFLEAMPETVSLAPEKARSTVLEWIMKTDPGRGMGLLEGLPPEERYQTVASIFSGSIYDVTPESFYDFQSMLAADPPAEALRERARMWANLMAGEDSDWYRAWVLALPAGLNRDLALSALAGRIDDDPVAAAALRQQISNPEVAE